MSQDKLTYTRATTAALLGFATQVVLTALIFVLGFYTGSKALIAGAFYLIPGLWIWVLLWLIYNQHRLEREESLEAAQLADADARSAQLFDQAGDQLASSRRRLKNMYKWGLSLVSGFTSLYLIAVGGLLFYLNNNAFKSGALAAEPIKDGVNLSITALLLVLGWLGGFLVARYVSGMTRVGAWQTLRGGASTLIGNVFLGYLPLLVATALGFFGNYDGFLYLALILPIVMIVLGIEIAFGLVLGFYRPRTADELIRPAFDSRVLGLLTQPESLGKIFSETINYQFGFEVSKSWFMRLLGKALLPLAAVCLALVIAMTSAVIVEPHQQAVVTYNGAFVRIAEPGLSWKAPWPLGRAEKFDVNRVHVIELGSRAHIEDGDHHDMNQAILWTNQHVPEGAVEELMITAPSPDDVVNEDDDDRAVLGEMIGADIEVKYRISDLRQYAGVDNPARATSNPVQLLTTIAQNEVTRYYARHDTETLLSSGRADVGVELRSAIQSELDEYEVGLEVVFVSISGVHPPQEVADDYHARINALQEAQTAREKAQQEADLIYATVAGDRDRAVRMAEMVGRYQELSAQLNELDAEAEPEQYAELTQQVELQRAAIELLMVEGGGEVGQRLAQARATRWSLSLGAEARYLRLEEQMRAYELAPNYYPYSQYLDVLAQTMAGRHKTIIGLSWDADVPEVVLDLPIGSVPGVSLP